MESRLVGRDRELGIIDRAIVAVRGGEGRFLVVSGQAGIGKSRLAMSALRKAKEHDFAVLMGSSSPLQAGLAYAPVVEALRRFLDTLPDAESGRLLAGLHDIAGLIADPRLSPSPPTGDPELERTRMFEAVLRLVERITERRPALLVVDDLHWADRGTIELLDHIGRGSRRRRLLLWCGYRSAEPGGPLAALAMSMRRESGLELALEPLSDNAVRELVGDLLGTEPRDDLVAKVTARAQGVPLFVTALVGGGIHGDVPVIVRDVVLDRLQRLDDRARSLLELIAVAGAAGSPRLLRTAWSEDGFDAVLRKLVDQGLIEELVDGPALTYRVSHPLYAEVAYAELTVGQRRSLHATIASTVDRGDVLKAAPHYRDAGDLVDPVRAGEVLGAAGKRALEVHDAQEAVNYLSAALHHVDPVDHPELMDGLARALQASGRLDDAASIWDHADEMAQRQGDSLRQRILVYYRSMLEAERGNVHTPLLPLQFEDDEPPIVLMVRWLLAGRANDLARMWQVLDRMLVLTEHQDTPEARVVAHFGAGKAARMAGDFAAAHTQNQIAIDVARTIETPEREQYAYGPRLQQPALLVLRGDVSAALAAADNPGGAAVQFYLPGAVHYVVQIKSWVTFVSGDLPKALEIADESLSLAEQVGQDRLIGRSRAARAFLLVENGDLAGAERDLKVARECHDATHDDLVMVTDLAETAYALRTGAPVDDTAFCRPRLINELLTDTLRLAYAGYLAVMRKDHTAAQRILDDLRSGGRTSPFLDALALRQEGLMAGSDDLLRQAAQRLEAMGARLALPRTLQPLSKREREIVRLVGQGLTNAQIAQRLFLSERTIETHLHNSYKKLRLTTRAALTRWALEHSGD